jgi:hypothetical protein
MICWVRTCPSCSCCYKCHHPSPFRSWSMCLHFLARVLVLFSRIQQPNVFHHCWHVQLVQFNTTVVLMNSSQNKRLVCPIYIFAHVHETLYTHMPGDFRHKSFLMGYKGLRIFLGGTTTLLMWSTVFWIKSRKATVMQYTLGGLTFR